LAFFFVLFFSPFAFQTYLAQDFSQPLSVIARSAIADSSGLGISPAVELVSKLPTEQANRLKIRYSGRTIKRTGLYPRAADGKNGTGG
jgi:hypothetical protein